MITVDILKKCLEALHYSQTADNVYIKNYAAFDCQIKVDFNTQKIIYPTDKGLKIHRETTCNFSESENFVVLECITSLMDKGYKPNNIELEKPMPGGHDDTGGFCDIQVKDNNDKTFLLIECKKADEFDKYWKRTLANGDQLFRYYNSYRQAKALCLYTSDLIDGEIKRTTNIISMEDNEEYLSSNTNLKSFKQVQAENGNKEDYFDVWHDTYQLDYSTQGIFEEDIETYTIGKTKYTVDDLREVDERSIQKKYNEFATILRQHNVGSHENAFDKLVNLFLAKIVDETINPRELQFRWKGAAFDDYYSLQDRLQKLYKEGMEKYLGEEVTYIDQHQVSDAFHLFKNDPDATKAKVLDYFRQLKFYTNNDFAFLDVHNKELFFHNAEILKKMIKMLEDIKLKTETRNQFLGDLFEGFLDDGVKQSEGQYFTPLPIVKFLVSSLPLEQIIKDSDDIPLAIDYACGAGHFLTEYAAYIKEFVEKYKKAPVSEYYAKTYGIEKEYRLSKVSKVSAFMYRQDDIQIIYGDALADNPRIKDGTFSVLIANPPYRVKGFIEMLKEEERRKFRLAKQVADIAKNNLIETFFVERAQQLLKENGVAAIILPSSILSRGHKSKSDIYSSCREIILQYFDIIAIAEMGKRTFGKTPTVTVAMFLRRKTGNPDIAQHYKNRVNAWFNNDHTKDRIFEDEDLIKDYCLHCNIDPSQYLEWLKGGKRPDAEIFDEYEKKSKKGYIEIEKIKLYYFLLAQSNSSSVIVIKSPSDKDKTPGKTIKDFLGYEWRDSRGNEGIKYLGNSAQTSDDDYNSICEKKGIYSIKTPLFDPSDFKNANKINYIIRSNYVNGRVSIPEDLKQFVSEYSLTDMLDFSGAVFNNAIRISGILKFEHTAESKYPTARVASVCDINPSKTEISNTPDDMLVSFIEMASVSNDGFIEKKVDRPFGELRSGGYTYFADGDIIIAKITPCMENGKCAVAENLTNGIGMGSTEFHTFRCDKSKILAKYLFLLLNQEKVRKAAEKAMTGASGHRRVPSAFYERMLIPVPPLPVQQQIISECAKIDEDFKAFRTSIETCRQEIRDLLAELDTAKQKEGKLRLSDADKFKVAIGKRVLDKDLPANGTIPVYSANVFEPFGYIDKLLITDFSMPSVLWGIDGDWMVNYIPKNVEFYPTDHCGVLRCNTSDINPRYLAHMLESEGKRMGFSRDYRASIDRVKGITFTVPDRKTQDDAVSQIINLEAKIKEAQDKLESLTGNTAEILKKYLE